MSAEYIDAHVHLWDLKSAINSWVINGQDQRIKQNFLLDDYLYSNKSKPNGLVTIEAADGDHSIDEVKWLANQPFHGIQHKHIAYLDLLQHPLDFIAALAEFADYPFVRGFRHILSYSPNSIYSPCNSDFSSERGKVQNLYQNLSLLHSRKYIFNCQMYPRQLLNIKDIIVDSKVKCIIDHCGLPVVHGEQLDEWLAMLEVYKNTNVYFKLSGFDINNNQTNFKLILDSLLEKISDNRLVFGSNYPLAGEGALKLLQDFLVLNYNSEINDKILFANAKKLFKFD